MTDKETGDRAETLALIVGSAAFLESLEQLRRARALRGHRPGISRDFWEQVSKLGWLSLRVPNEQGGIGLGIQELCVLSERLGACMAPEPVPEAICTAPFLSGTLLEDVMSGSLIVLPAWQERAGDLESKAPTVRLAQGKLIGSKKYVHMAEAAGGFVVTTSNGLQFVRKDAPGLSVLTTPLQDGGHFSELTFDNTPTEPIKGSFETVQEEITLGIAAYLLGVMRRAFAITKDYVTTRTQFDRSIGSFQVIQHRMVDLYIRIQLVSASIQQAAAILESSPSLAAAKQAVSRAKARASDVALLVTRQAIQLHGGIGYTDEADIGLFLRKAMALMNCYGSAAAHRARYLTLVCAARGKL